MTLQRRLFLIMALVLLGAFGVVEALSYAQIRREAVQELRTSAERVRNVLMAMRRVYHHQFIDSGVPLDEKTMGFLPAFAMSRISAMLADWDKSGFSFNNVSDRPRNPRNQADAVELEAIDYFRHHPGDEVRFTSFADARGEPYYHYARPIWVEAYCLKCHGSREQAPETVRTRYNAAYGYQEGELRGILSIKIPARQLGERIRDDFLRNLAAHLGVFLLLSLATAWAIRRYVGRPLAELHDNIGAVAAGHLDARVAALPGEFGQIGMAFNRMADAVQVERHQLAHSEERFRSVADSATDAIVVIDHGGTVVFWNAGAERIFGHPAAAMVGAPVLRIIPEAYRAAHSAGLARAGVADAGRFLGRTQEAVGRHRDGHDVPIEISLSGWTSGGERHFAAIVRDIGERKAAEASLRLAASVFANAREGIIILDAAGAIVDINGAFAAMTGVPRMEAVGRGLAAVLGPQGEDAAPPPVAGESDRWQGELWRRQASGELSAFMLSLTAVRDGTGRVVHQVGLLSDITALKLHQEELERIAYHDPLTALPNRLLLKDRLQQAQAQTTRNGGLLAVCYLDLDGFKPVNDAFGHDAGDRMLKDVAQRLRDAVRAGDTVARLGGDEFALLLVGVAGIEDLEQTLSRLLTVVARPYAIDGQEAVISASIGVTLYPGDPGTADQLLQHADAAMYDAKAGGRNRFRLFNPEQDRLVHDYRAELERIRTACETGELCLHYQPRVAVEGFRLVGLEAVIRWRHPEQGLLLPARFMPLVEESDLAVPVSAWAIREVVRQAAAWQRAGSGQPVSVALSPRHLHGETFVEWLHEVLAAEPELPVGQLVLQLPASAALADMATAARVIEHCHRLGVRVALDDFGISATSLPYLRQLAVDELKIAPGLVREALADANSRAVMRGIAGLAHAFGQAVGAEGVDEPEQAALLVRCGCDILQGAVFGQAMPPAAVSGWIAAFAPDAQGIACAQLPVTEDDVPLLAARVAQRQWCLRFEAYLAGTADELAQRPTEDPTQCDFGRWYYGAGRARYAGLAAFEELETVHRRFHVVANTLMALGDAGQRPAALERLPELREAAARVLELTHDLLVGTVAGRR